jgi:hypothetical protein
MKNIIGWRDDQYEQFGRSLTRRIRLVTRPMLRNIDAENRLKEDRHRFQRQTLDSRLEIVAGICRRYLKRSGYRTIMLNDGSLPWYGIKRGRTMGLCMLSVQANCSTRDILTHWNEVSKVLQSRFDIPDEDSTYRWKVRFGWGHRVPRQKEIRDVRQLAVRVVLCSLGKVPRARVEGALPTFQGDITGRHFEATLSYPLPGKVFLQLVDSIDSERGVIPKLQ